MFKTKINFIAFAYIFSIINFPLELNGSSILTKLFPILLLFILPLVRMVNKKPVYLLRGSALFFGFQSAILISVIVNGGSYIFFFNFFLLSLGVLLYFGCFEPTERMDALIEFLKSVVFFSCIVSIAAIFNYHLYELATKLFFIIPTPYYESQGQVGSFYPNPNLFGNMTAIVSSIAVFLYKNNFFKKIQFLIIMGLLLIGIVYSGSRMSLAVFVLSIFYLLAPRLVLCQLRNGLVFLITYSLLIATTFLFGMLADHIELNFRDVIWDAAFSLIMENPLSGIGLAKLPEHLYLVNSLIEQGQAANNFIIGFIAENGIIAFGILSLFFLKSFIRKGKLSSLSLEIPFCFLLVSQFSESFYTYVGSYVILMMSFLIVRKYEK